MTKPLSITIIGTGNLAQHIAVSFSNRKDAELLQVFNHRKTKAALLFAKQHQKELVTDYKNIKTSSDIYFICVKDDAIVEVVKNLIPLKIKGIVVHTSGSMDLSILENVSSNTGVYYPLQTFTKGAIIDWSTTPVLIEANTKKSITVLKFLARMVSKTVKQISSVKRLQLHLAAVFACNFTNALYASAFELVETNLSKKDTELLRPIMLQSFNKLNSLSPKHAQTGPAMRNDKIAMKRHLELLSSNKELTNVYKLLSQLIINQQSHSK